MNSKALFDKLGVEFKRLPGQIDARSSEIFRQQFDSLFSSPEAKLAKGVLYVWATALPMPRLQDKSDILYIGKTDHSLTSRHRRYAKDESSGFNWQRYQYIIPNFGPISVFFVIHPNPKNVERRALDLYFEEHLENPPLNRKYG